MKNSLIVLSTFIILPSFATCPIENGETSCSIAQFTRQQLKPTYAQT